MVKILTLCLSLFLGVAGAQEPVPTIPDTIRFDEWLVCGPFLVGTREGITEAVPDPAELDPKEGDSLRSALVAGGVTIWRRVKTDSSGWLNTDYPDVQWDSIQDYYGISGIVTTGYAFVRFYHPRPARCLAVATKLGGFILNKRTYLGDVYGNNWFKTPVLIDSGFNRLTLRLSGYGDQRVRFLLIPAPDPVFVVKEDITAPDIIADSAATPFAGIPLFNTTEKPVDSVVLKLTLDTIVLAETVINNIPGLGARKVPVRLHIPALPYDTTGYRTAVTLRWRNYEKKDSFSLRSRRIDQPHKRTFVSALDSSCQYYAVLYPRDYNPNRRYGLIVSLHGAGVEADGLNHCFKPKDWAFIVCPTNRRPFGFDWQDWGRMDAIEVLEQALANLPVDPDRVVLTGHSMGGHGTWHIGLTHPDRFAAIAPAAGWPSLPLYVPTFLQRSVIFSEPAKLAIREMAHRPDNVPAFIENALNLPVFILHGANDNNVPPVHGRNFALWLAALGYNYRYKEVPGKEHWWQYDDTTFCVDDPDLIAFLREARRNPGPRHIRFRTADISQSNSCYWLKIDRVQTWGRDAFVAGFADDSVIRLKTDNVTQITLFLDQRLFFPATVRIEIDRKTAVKTFYPPGVITIRRTKNGWQPGRLKEGKLFKSEKQAGPAKRVLMQPFTIIYGTQNPELTDLLRHYACQEALRWLLIGNGQTEILPDTAPGINFNRNLILLGGPAENKITEMVAQALPIKLHPDRVEIMGKKIAGDTLGVILTYPNPLKPEKLLLVRMGTNPGGTKLSFFWGVIGSGTGIPDFIVFDPRVRNSGWNGVRAAGFFSQDWQLDPGSTFIGN